MNSNDVIKLLEKAEVVKRMSFSKKAEYGSRVAKAALDYYCYLHGLEWRESTRDEDCNGVDAVLSNGIKVQVKTTEHPVGNLMMKQWYLDTRTKAVYHPDNFAADMVLLVNQYGVYSFSSTMLIPILESICKGIGYRWTDKPGERVGCEYPFCDLYFYRDDREKTRTGKKRPVLHARVNYRLGTKL